MHRDCEFHTPFVERCRRNLKGWVTDPIHLRLHTEIFAQKWVPESVRELDLFVALCLASQIYEPVNILYTMSQSRYNLAQMKSALRSLCTRLNYQLTESAWEYDPVATVCSRSPLGCGTFSTVHAATITTRGNNQPRRVACKTFKYDDTWEYQQFFRELAILQLMQNCPNVPRLIAVAFSDHPQIFMTLGDCTLNQAGKMPAHTIDLYARQLLYVVAVAHGRGITHKDIKPSNIVLLGSRLLLIDWGSGDLFMQDQLVCNTYCTTKLYRAPELWMMRCNFHVQPGALDVWSCGCVIAEMICGHALFTQSELTAIVYELDLRSAYQRAMWQLKRECSPRQYVALRSMLEWNPSERASATVALSEWIKCSVADGRVKSAAVSAGDTINSDDGACSLPPQ